MIKRKIESRFTNKGSIKALRPIHIAEDISWNYGEDVVIYDVRDKSPFVSYYIVCSSQNEHRLRALVQTAKESLYDNYHDVKNVEGKRESTWILIDSGDIIVQLFTKEERNRVDFDALYQDCPHKVIKALKEPSYKRRKKPVAVQNY